MDEVGKAVVDVPVAPEAEPGLGDGSVAAATTDEEKAITWLAHARAYTESKCGNLAPVSRSFTAQPQRQ
jgi:hypothetical protein